MQNSLEKMKAPFDVLIQGPTGRRFVRNVESHVDVVEAEQTVSSTAQKPEDAPQGLAQQLDLKDASLGSAQQSGLEDASKAEIKEEAKGDKEKSIDGIKNEETKGDNKQFIDDNERKEEVSRKTDVKSEVTDQEDSKIELSKKEEKIESTTPSKPTDKSLAKRETSDLDTDVASMGSIDADSAPLDENTNKGEKLADAKSDRNEPTVGSAIVPGAEALSDPMLSSPLNLGLLKARLALGNIGLHNPVNPLAPKLTNPLVAPKLINPLVGPQLTNPLVAPQLANPLLNPVGGLGARLAAARARMFGLGGLGGVSIFN